MHPSINSVDSNILRVRLSEESRQLLQINDLSEACSRGESSIQIAKILKEMKSNCFPNHLSNKESSSIFCQTDTFGRNALHYAAMKGRRSVIRLLLKESFDPNTSDIHGSYPIHLAIQCKQYDVAIELSKITKPNLKNYRNETAILLLSKINEFSPKQLELLSDLIKYGNDVNIKDCRQCNPLFFTSNKPILLKKLLNNGGDTKCIDSFGRNALFNAIYAVNTESTELLINSGCNVEIKDDFNHTPLMLAACFGKIDIIQCLIKYGANVNYTIQSDLWVMSPLSFAIRHSNYDIAKLLIQNGATIDIMIGKDDLIWDLFDISTNQVSDESFNDKLNKTDIEMDLEIYTMPSSLSKRASKTLELLQRSVEKKKRMELLEFMKKTETDRKRNALLSTQLVKRWNVPPVLIQLIASPLDWY